MKSSSISLLAALVCCCLVLLPSKSYAFSVVNDKIRRREVLDRLLVLIGSGSCTTLVSSPPVWAFDGSGSSSYAGRTPATKAALQKTYKQRIVADVADFKILGRAIDKGETEGNAWVNFFITFARREADEFDRTYAALVDFRGIPTKNPNIYEGGDGYLLAASFTKQGKPPDSTPAVKSYYKLYKAFDGIEAAGKAGSAVKAKSEWTKVAALLSDYLQDVGLPSDLKDPMYQ